MSDYTTPHRDSAAVVTVDAQRDYVEQDSPVKSAGCSSVVEPLGRLVQGMRERGAPVFHLVRFYWPDGSNVDLCRRQAVEEGMRVLMPGSQGAELVSGIAPDNAPRLDPHLLIEGQAQELGPRDRAIYKPRWGGFYGTCLDAELRRAGIDTLIIAGWNFATSGRATLLEASERDYRIVLVPDACASVTDEAQLELGRVGVHLKPVEQCLNWADGGRRENGGA
ncbi:Nicotinamidase-related amidase [Limimonas halophila]|uniref:Nicotinamidase-related amidase n=1 Tax=Limimonas halophila TaxID=1082479 RepID=A0A1G7UMH2_9PROT|nr:isochorismatase family cysteine hydrolase [Limimonas halophila]SDG48558.1 Nicotinamidase-related amidase [Limimonas halophila]